MRAGVAVLLDTVPEAPSAVADLLKAGGNVLRVVQNDPVLLGRFIAATPSATAILR